MKLLDVVKERLDIKDENQDKKIQGYIDDITNKIKSICNRIDLPQELEYLVIRYTMNCVVFYKNVPSISTELLFPFPSVSKSTFILDTFALYCLNIRYVPSANNPL